MTGALEIVIQILNTLKKRGSFMKSNFKMVNRGEISVSTGGYQPRQPSQRFPFRPNSPPRVDNGNQPWYPMSSTARWWGSGPGVAQDYDAVIQNSSESEPTQNMNAIWASFNNFFGGQNPKANLMDKSDVVGFQMGVDEMSPPTATKSGFWVSINSFFGYPAGSGSPINSRDPGLDFGR